MNRVHPIVCLEYAGTHIWKDLAYLWQAWHGLLSTKKPHFCCWSTCKKKPKKTEVHQSYLSVCHSTTCMSNLELTQRGYDSLNPKQPVYWAKDWVLMLPTEYSLTNSHQYLRASNTCMSNWAFSCDVITFEIKKENRKQPPCWCTMR